MLLTIIGDDLRQKYLAEEFKSDYEVFYADSQTQLTLIYEKIQNSDVVILPIPFTRDGMYINSTEILINDFFKIVNSDATIFAGVCQKYLDEHKHLIDYNEIEGFVCYNARLTAEATVAIAINETDFSLSDSKILILGNGRIGKFCSKFFKPFGAELYISARKAKDFEYIIKSGNYPVNSNQIYSIDEYDVIVNTIPANIISLKTLSTKKPESPIIDLASKNSGLCNAENYIDASSLPGKYCPKSSSKYLYTVIRNYIKEEAVRKI